MKCIQFFGEKNSVFLVSFWCSIRVAVAFVGFLGMVAHYSQKISVGIALVCMVNHSAIDHHKYSVAMPLTQADIDCPRANNTVKIVNKKIYHLIIEFSSNGFYRKVHIHGQKIFKVLS
jgi:hypothetical protein